ncbi:hypothetical protein C8D88_101782 [Lentzea atacamensis]|uniref:SHOCT domain-containing protein n=1 Tax=Lentzea atacamensis TaxID=531938 RepID=A0A316IC14_9PSEU|nr:hypothetical protein [Lentzea atacamensis]PWK90761.1 hypothetical protein C8D88_101782 [Lentzea atacamensis]
MAWQDELRELDNALAEGRISADDYRRRRDEVLSGSGSAPAPSPQNQGSANAPFRWSATPPQAGPQTGPPSGPQPVVNPDATQVVTPQAPHAAPNPNANPDATQVVNTGARNPDSERTQYVRPVQPQGGWQSASPQQGGSAAPPPWLSGDGNGFGADPSPAWVAQGPEVFDEKPSGAGKKILVVLLVLIVLGGIGTGVYFLVNRQGGGGDQTTAQSTPATPTTTSKPKPTDPYEIILDQMPAAGGKNDARSEVANLAKLVEEKVIEQGEADLIAAAGGDKSAWKAGNKIADEFGPTPDRFSILVIPTKSESDAAELVVKLKSYQESRGLVFIKDPLPDMPPSIVFEKNIAPDIALYRGIYASGKNLVRVNVDQFPPSGEAGLSGSYQRQMQAMLKAFPAAS